MDFAARRPLSSVRALGVLLVAAGLAGCASGGSGGPSYITGSSSEQCAPYARGHSDVRLYGEAADWWHEASGRYARSHRPAPGSVLVFRRTGRLPDGHVSVVRAVVGRRRILVSQANWVHHRISRDEPVVDVSPDNDWSDVRVWWSPAGQLGSHVYPTYGFILPDPLLADRRK